MTHADWLIHMPRKNEKCNSRIHSVRVFFIFNSSEKKHKKKEEKIEKIKVKFLKKLNEGLEKK